MIKLDRNKDQGLQNQTLAKDLWNQFSSWKFQIVVFSLEKKF